MKIANDRVEKEVKSREGRVLFTSSKVYKIVRAERAYGVHDAYKEAERRGVPVPSTAKFTAPLEENNTTTDVHGIVMDRVSGRFFQLAKGGGESIMINEIRKMMIPKQIEKMIAGLKAAAAAGMGDPQGFIDTSNMNNPLHFIDIHIGRGGGGGGAFEQSILAAEEHLVKVNSEKI